ncbi:MAG: alpha/beta fold hydrolase [Bacteroidia bacterium]|nr:alpha/beta fold hydrolase [Bacteroidia bacterium]
MKTKLIAAMIALLLPLGLAGQAIDTMISVGKHRIHFSITPGDGDPILFEAGSGNDGSIWNDLLGPIHEITGATLITYDRGGMGKSELNPDLPDDEKAYALRIIEDLEKGLEQLGIKENITYVAHSYGGFCAAIYADRNPEKVKSIVLLDANLPDYFTDEIMQEFVQRETPEFMNMLKEDYTGNYYEALAWKKTVAYRKQISFPSDIPIIDIVAEYPPNGFNKPKYQKYWTKAHQEFARNNENVKGITAKDCSHYVFFLNPPMIIQSIVEAYLTDVPNKKQLPILRKSLEFSINGMNDIKGAAAAYRHSEDDLNRWGYDLMNGGNNEQAKKVFELNVMRYPQSSNAYDSYGEVLFKLGKKEEAIKMYEKSIELNPENINGKNMLEMIKNQ